MGTAIVGNIALSSNHVFNPKPGDRQPLCKGPCNYRGMLLAVSTTSPGRGIGLLERPVIEKTAPGRESEFDLRKSRKTAPPYRVILHNDDFNKREYVVQVLLKSTVCSCGAMGFQVLLNLQVMGADDPSICKLWKIYCSSIYLLQTRVYSLSSDDCLPINTS